MPRAPTSRIALAFAAVAVIAMLAVMFAPIRVRAFETPFAVMEAARADHLPGTGKKVRAAGRAKTAQTGEPDLIVDANKMVAIARSYLGRRNPTGTRGPWCRDFVNMVLRQAGVTLADTSRRAIDALRLGTRVRTPEPGDLMLPGNHHVTFYAGRDGRSEGR